MVSVKTKTSVRTSNGTLPANTRAGLPREEAEKLEEAGHLEIVEEDGDETEVPDDYNDLRSVASEIEKRTDEEPMDYEKATLTEYVKKHG